MGGMADMLRGMGGGGGGGGMPDLASIMNNPQMMAMAQQMMANGGLASMMQNPAVANMVCVSLDLKYCTYVVILQMSRIQSGGPMPSMEELMANPALRDMYVDSLEIEKYTHYYPGRTSSELVAELTSKYWCRLDGLRTYNNHYDIKNVATLFWLNGNRELSNMCTL